VAFVTVDGIRFHVQRLSGSASTGIPVVMAHGLFSGSLASWFFTSAPLLARHHPVFLYDLRGHGRTDRPATGYSSSIQAGDLDALTADLPPFVLVGHSFGSVVAVRFARRHPDRVAALALVEPPLVSDDGRVWWSVSRREVAAMARADQQPRRAAASQRLIAETTMVDELRREPPVSDADLAALPSSLLVAFGRRSPAVEAADRVRRVRPDADVRLFDGGHSLHVDCTAELTASLLDLATGADETASEVAYG
jgi:pimeloyl-ACP methyl ester carboxylesterase